MTVEIIISCVVAYLLGSINSAIIYCRLCKLPDPRSLGSNNPGATNVYRIAGKKGAVLVLSFDVLKGVLTTWPCYFMGFEPYQIGLAAIAVCLGHMFPVFFSFKGGKSVATAFGCFLPIGISFGGLALASWLAVFKLSGFSSLSSIITVTLIPLLTYVLYPKYFISTLMLAIFIIARHIPNIIRLANGTEPKAKHKL